MRGLKARTSTASGPIVSGQNGLVVAQLAGYGEVAHAKAAHVAEGHRRAGTGRHDGEPQGTCSHEHRDGRDPAGFVVREHARLSRLVVIRSGAQ